MGTQTLSIPGKGSSCCTSCPLRHGHLTSTSTLKFASAMGIFFISILLEIKIAAEGLPSVHYPGILKNVRWKERKLLSWILLPITFPGNQSWGRISSCHYLRFMLARGSSSTRTFCQAETARPVCELLAEMGDLHFPDWTVTGEWLILSWGDFSSRPSNL